MVLVRIILDYVSGGEGTKHDHEKLAADSSRSLTSADADRDESALKGQGYTPPNHPTLTPFARSGRNCLLSSVCSARFTCPTNMSYSIYRKRYGSRGASVKFSRLFVEVVPSLTSKYYHGE